MDCPNNRYVNDEAICQATVSMLAKIGIKVNLLAQPKALYFKKVLNPSLDTSFFLLGWTPEVLTVVMCYGIYMVAMIKTKEGEFST